MKKKRSFLQTFEITVRLYNHELAIRDSLQERNKTIVNTLKNCIYSTFSHRFMNILLIETGNRECFFFSCSRRNKYFFPLCLFLIFLIDNSHIFFSLLSQILVFFFF